MLVLSRKKNESIVIGDNVRIEVLKISGNTIRLGIVAPREVSVLRGEIAPYEVDSNAQATIKSNRSVDTKVAGTKVAEARSNYADAKNPLPSSDASSTSGRDFICEITLPLESEEPSSLPNPFVVQAM